MEETFLQKKFFEDEKGKICYFALIKDSSKPTAVFLHGLSANHTTWMALAKKLSDSGMNVILPDLRGHGYSDKTRKKELYEISVLGDDIKKIMDKERIVRPVLIGYSYGGYVALDLAVKYPSEISGLILISAGHVNPLKYKKTGFLIKPAYHLVNLAAWLISWQRRKEYYYYNQQKDLGYWRSTLKGLTTMPFAVNLWLLAQTAKIDFRRVIFAIACPTLIIRSLADPFLSATEANDIISKIKGSELAVIDESSHFLASRHQEKVGKKIIDFLKIRRIIV